MVGVVGSSPIAPTNLSFRITDTAHMALVQSHSRDKQRSCLSKRRYWSHVDALVMASRQQERAGAPALDTYRCGNCGGWHLTRRV